MQNKLPSRRAGGVKRFVQDCFEKSRKCKTNILYFSISSHVETWGDQDEFAWGKALPDQNTVQAGLQGRLWPQPADVTESPAGAGAAVPTFRTWASDPNDLKLRA